MVDHFLRFLRDDGGMLGLGISLSHPAANASGTPTASILDEDGGAILDEDGAFILENV